MFRASFFFYLRFSFFCFVSWNCTKIDNTSIGADLLPAVDNVNTFDTSINLIATNFDSATKDCFIYFPEDDHALGYINADPLFGTTQSSIYTELKPNVFPFSFPANSNIDSVVLVLSYRSTFGDTSSSQKVNVYKIADTFKPDSSSCRSYNYEMPAIGSAIYSPRQLNDSNQLRIRLDDSFGQSLLLRNPTNPISTDSAFKALLKGFAIVPDMNFGGRALSYFSLIDTNTKLAVYYKSVNTTIDTLVSNFRLTFLSASANHVVRNHAGAEVANHQAKPPQGDEEIYIQTTPGTYAEIKIPDLSKISNRIIHRAVLSMDQVYDNNSFLNKFPTPFVLFIDLRDTSFSTGYKPVPCDLGIISGTPDINSFGGFRKIVKDPFGHDISRYTFNISRYLQKIVTNKITNPSFRLRAPDNIINRKVYFDECGQSVIPFIYPVNLPVFGQVKLGGGDNLNYKMKLQIIYSII